jgi:hypothetical protein
MGMNSKKSILAIFEENERNVVTLYRIYRRRFPESFTTWKKLCNEERKHVQILHGLKMKYPDDADYFTVSAHAWKMISYVVNFVSNQFEDQLLKKINAKEALEVALRIERSMVEQKYFSLFNPEIVEVRQAFRRLNHDVERHINILIKALNKYQ